MSYSMYGMVAATVFVAGIGACSVIDRGSNYQPAKASVFLIDRRFLWAAAYALSEPGRAYAIYLAGGSRADLSLDLPAGRYRAEWIDTRTGAVARAEDVEHGGGRVVVASPSYSEDIALRILSRR